MSEVRCLRRAGGMTPRIAAPNRMDAAARREMVEFLEADVTRPLYVSPAKHRADIEGAIDTMTIAERVYIEIEMQDRRGTMYSSDYDPLRG